MQITFSTTANQLGSIGQGPPPPPQGGPRPNLDSLASKLGVTTDDLEQARQSGESLSDFARSKGVSRDTLLNAVKQDMKAGKPSDAPELSDDQLTQMATRMIDRKPGERGDDGGPRAASSPSGSFMLDLPDSTVLEALRSSSASDDASAGFKQFLQQLASAASSGGYGSQGETPASSGSLGVDALA